jgi:pyruvate dehydrogenase E2 component (dihydrolipoamide acetyltransferase)
VASYEFKLPDLGEGVVEGEIVKWLVKPGDTVAEDQGVVEVMTDKATVAVPSPRTGKVVALHGKEGDMAKVHQTLVTLEVDGASVTSPAPAHAPAPAAIPSPVLAAVPSTAKVLATPVTRRMAREHGIDLTAISGSGPSGRVTKADVMAVMDGGATRAHGAAALAAVPGLAEAPKVLANDERLPLRGLRRKIAAKMVKSKFTAPHFTFVEEVDATSLVALRKRMNDALAASGEKAKLSFLPFICKAVVGALKAYPHLNANMDEEKQELIVRARYNLGIAVATDEGLTVPVVKDVDRLSLRALSDEINRLSTAARDRKLSMEDLSGGTFTITSLGQTGGLFATPIINHPEVGILGIHRLRKRPMVVDDEIVIREMMNVSLSFDHRVIDGSVGAEFTYAVIRRLESPELLFLELG